MFLILDGEMKEEEAKALFEKIKNKAEGFNAHFQDVEEKGRVEIAYPIKKRNMGYTYVVNFTMPAENVNLFRHELDLEESVLRYFFLVKGEEKEA